MSRLKFICVALAFMHVAVLAQGPNDGSLDVLLKKLGSDNPRDREFATKELMKYPESAVALRQLLKSGDTETKRRAAAILDSFGDKLTLLDLNAAVNEGDIEGIIVLSMSLTDAKNDISIWDAVRRFSSRVGELHRKTDGGKIDVSELWGTAPTIFIKNNRVTSETKTPTVGRRLVRANEIIGNFLPPDFPNDGATTLVSDGQVRIGDAPGQIILARGDVAIRSLASRSLIVSCGDVVIEGNIGTSLVIARGTVTCNGLIGNSRIVCEKFVAGKNAEFRNCVINENEPSPLGYVKWRKAAVVKKSESK
jgi:hypothetical protein